MLKSMTGFGKCQLSENGRKMSVEIKTINHRFLDLNIRMPRSMASLEEVARREIRKYIARGRVEIYVTYASEVADAQEALVDMSLAGAYASAAREICSALGVENDLRVSHILSLPDVVAFSDSEAETAIQEELLARSVDGACEELVKAREREGRELEKDISWRLDRLAELAASIETRADTVVSEYQERLAERVRTLAAGAELDPMRMAQEVAIFADRCDITEEVIRVRSHVEQFRSLMSQNEPQGRNLDFLLQELNREFNTIGSKSQDRELAKNVIEAKGQVEKIKEQIQNIE